MSFKIHGFKNGATSFASDSKVSRFQNVLGGLVLVFSPSERMDILTILTTAALVLFSLIVANSPC